jgi:hypothetical protein
MWLHSAGVDSDEQTAGLVWARIASPGQSRGRSCVGGCAGLVEAAAKVACCTDSQDAALE